MSRALPAAPRLLNLPETLVYRGRMLLGHYHPHTRRCVSLSALLDGNEVLSALTSGGPVVGISTGQRVK